MQEAALPHQEAEPLSELAQQVLAANQEALRRLRETNMMFVSLKVMPSEEAAFQTPSADYSGAPGETNPNDAVLPSLYEQLGVDLSKVISTTETDKSGVVHTSRIISIPDAEVLNIVEHYKQFKDGGVSLKVSANRFPGPHDI